MAQQSRRHHFIPQFLSKLWAGKDGKLCEFSRPHKQIVDRRKPPKAVGFEPHLYSLPGAVPEDIAFVEDRFFAIGGQRACNALQAILTGDVATFSHEHRGAFTRFLVSLHHRTPERVRYIRESLANETQRIIDGIREEIRTGARLLPRPGIDFEEYAAKLMLETDEFSWGKSLMSLVDSQMVGPAIFNMRWHTRQLLRSEHDLLLGDHALIRSNGIAHPEGHIALPLGPRLLFLATSSAKTATQILSQPDERIVRDCNRETLRHAKRYVYAADDRQAAFIDNRLGRGI